MEITILPQNITINVEEKESILSGAKKAGIFFPLFCGGYGICGKCKVKVENGNFSSLSVIEKDTLTKEEQINNIRLACCLYAKTDGVIKIEEDSNFKNNILNNRKENLEYKLDSRFIFSSCKETDEYGIAFDIGTTSVVGILWNLYNHSFLNAKAQLNSQYLYGADVLTRISYCMAETKEEEEKKTKELQSVLIDCINNIIKQLCKTSNIDKKKIKKIVVVANTTISHLFLGIVPKGLSKAPFQPSFKGTVIKQAEQLGLKVFKETPVYLLPNLGGHVGSDITADILAERLFEKKGLFMLADIGTNGELVLSLDGEIFVCSTAAGPAFEGNSIFQGMRAEQGAIERFSIENGEVQFCVVDNTFPKGICGSGLIDIVAELLREGIIDETGRLLDSKRAKDKGILKSLLDRLKKGEKGNEFVIYWGKEGQKDIVITQGDIREIQLAKAAVYSGIITLLKIAEKKIEDIQCFIIAGAFGNYINKYNAVRIGLFPSLDIERFKFIGNAAGKGASIALLSKEAIKDIENIEKRTKYVALANDIYFQEEYISGINFPKE